MSVIKQLCKTKLFLEGFEQAKPIILEPIMLVVVETPNEYVGRVQGDLAARRGCCWVPRRWRVTRRSLRKYR